MRTACGELAATPVPEGHDNAGGQGVEHGNHIPACTAVGVIGAGTTADVLITAVPQLVTTRHHLRCVEPEARAVQAAYGGASRATLLLNISVAELDRALQGCSTWCFAGHGDAPLSGENVPAFVKNGEIESVSIRTLAETLRRHTPPQGNLKLVVLTACCTYELGRALQEQACVPFVVCWRTVLADTPGKLFGEAFANARAGGDEPAIAFGKSCTAVETVTEAGRLDTGASAQVQKYQLFVDPKCTNTVDQRTHRVRATGRHAVGYPELLDGSAPPMAALPVAAPQLAASVTYVPRSNDLKRAVDAVTALGGVTSLHGLKGQGGVSLASGSTCDRAIVGSIVASNDCLRSATRWARPSSLPPSSPTSVFVPSSATESSG